METTEGRSMTLNDIAKLGKLLGQFLARFAGCFVRPEGRALLLIYVRGLLSDVPRKNVEAIALRQNVAPRTLQRFLESVVWDEQLLLDRCQQVIVADHAHPDAIGCIDDTGTAKSGRETAGVKRQYNGNRGKVENCVNHVALAYSAPGFNCLLDARLYLPEEWASDPARRKKRSCLTMSSFKLSHRSRWIWSTVRRPMAFRCRLGLRTKPTVVTVHFSTA
jgi:SRSO17 transposase